MLSPATSLVTNVDTKLLTYAELADALGIAPASAKRLAIRRGWQKTPGNDGKARVAVPVERLEIERRPTSDSPSDDTDDDPSDVTSDNQGLSVTIPRDDTSDRGDTELPAFLAATAVLTQHIERLERELAESKSALEIERVRAAQVEALTAILEAERQRTAELRTERDLERTRAVRADGLQAALEAEQRRSTELREERDRWQSSATSPRSIWSWLKRTA